ncbi:MAG: hypothetical protein EOM03_17820 [Clostridia bacterium]|nr:hypothetical protein [Clostridia bacterium]
MSSDDQLNRRFFFRKSVASILDCVCGAHNGKDESILLDEERKMTAALWSDFTPEMIKFEAERLGIDPEDTEEVFKRIQSEMMERKC